MQKVEDTINALCEVIIGEINKPYEYQDIRGIARAAEALGQLIRAKHGSREHKTRSRGSGIHERRNHMSEENVIRFYETLAEILSRREGVKIKVTIRRKEDGVIVNRKEDVA